MAVGGMGSVTRPTLFLAGEAGREEYAFSGAGRSFAGGGAGGGGGDMHVHIHAGNIVGGKAAARELALMVRSEFKQMTTNGTKLG
jgi:hypothetical protein